MILSKFLDIYSHHPQLAAVKDWLQSDGKNLQITGLNGSALSLITASLYQQSSNQMIVLIGEDADEAAYLYNDIKNCLSEQLVYFFPSSYKKSLKLSTVDPSNEILRTEILNKLANHTTPFILVTYPEALFQKVVSLHTMQTHLMKLSKDEDLSIDFLMEMLFEYGFQKVDFVYEPGQFSVRGGIVDIFSYAYELPYRLDFFGDTIDSIRIFDIETQLSKEQVSQVEIIPDLHKDNIPKQISFFDFIKSAALFVFSEANFIKNRINQLYDESLVKANSGDSKIADLHDTRITGDEFIEFIHQFKKIEVGERTYFDIDRKIAFHTSPQPVFHKNFDLIAADLKQGMAENYRIYIMSDSVKQTDRIAAIFKDREDDIAFQAIQYTLHQGFIDHDLKLYCYSDHQIFERFHKYRLRTDKTRQGKVVMTLKELNQFQLGDYMVHVDHGVGTFGGLVKTNVNGKMQEMVKLIYRDDDIIFVSIHALHRISKYKGKEGTSPKINKLGSGAWERLKERTKSKVKDIARELIKLYAQRKSERAYQYTPDSYLQHELEASFIYEDTPDQVKATEDIKHDMESDMPMDRLVCGDVGFGKTEVAVRAAFKAASDGKQTAVLVPTTLLAFQHFNTFKDRLANFPVRVEYLSRARTAKETKAIVESLAQGEIDIIIGTHKLISKTVSFKDLGLLIIDEEQRFGVSVKEKLKKLKVNVDTITMTATPIPRTLQFSLMGARDLSIINTPPPNRYPVQTELHEFDEDLIREAILLEMERNGQVFFVHNRVKTIYQIERLIKDIVPGARVAVGHGQMKPDELEEVILDFIEYEYDVLIATTIIESGIDIPNANTIIINSAHRFGLSDLHQLRGRVGRSNRKAYCYLLTPEKSLLTPDARRRLSAIETFSELGSGFNVAMQDLDIRGAGNMLGAEQSGFIADLGYETYQRILNEAVHELKDEEFAELYAEEIERENSSHHYVTDCQIDTDMELLFPTDYIENVSERMALYRELDTIETEADLKAFEQKIADRFGQIPEESLDLFQVVRIRKLAIKYGIERLVLKNEKMLAYLVTNNNSPYYQSERFGKLLNFVATHPRQCQLREQNNRRSIVISFVKTINQALHVMMEVDG